MSEKNWRKCVICNVREHGSKKKPIFFAKFPLNKARCREWLKMIGNEELVFLPIEKLHTSRRVCGKHFESKAFNEKRNRIKRWAVPTLNLSAAPLSDEQLSEFPKHVWNCGPVPSTNPSLLHSSASTKIDGKLNNDGN